MKKFFANPGRLLGLAIATVLTLAAPAGAKGLKQPNSPTGQPWDCIMTGNGQDGILFLNFTEDNDLTSGFPTFEGIFVQAGHKKVQTGREGSTGVGRTPSGSVDSFTNLFGGGFIDGTAGNVADNGGPGDWMDDSRGHRGNWSYNSKGQVIGSFYTVLSATSRITNFFETCIDEVLPIPLTNGTSFNIEVAFCFTNPVIVTNIAWNAGPPSNETGFTNLTFTNGNFTIGFIGITNNVSFVGTVVPGKRLTMVGTSAFGKFTIRGVPLIATPTQFPVTSPTTWTGTKAQDGFRYNEVFSMDATIIPNVFTVNGNGPAYTYNGTNSLCLISSQKKIGFEINELPFGTPGSVVAQSRATVGPLTNTKKAVSTKGVGDTVAEPDIIKFDASLTPFALP
jgi:hypothetical protein